MSGFLKDFRDGMSAYSEAMEVIRELRLWKYLVLPGILSVVFGLLILTGAIIAGGYISDWITENYSWQWGAAFVASASWVLAAILITLPSILFYKYIVLILLAPFMSPLSERVETYMLGENQAPPFSLIQFTKDMLRGIRVSLRNVFREIFFTLILLLLGTIPVIGIISAPVIFAVQAYYAGFGNMDYTLERHLGVRDSALFTRRYKGLALANGTLFLLLLMIPIAGLFVAPSLATVAGTLEVVPRLEQESRSV